eukprot:jgi/Chlat1/2454/Chrsp171S02341
MAAAAAAAAAVSRPTCVRPPLPHRPSTSFTPSLATTPQVRTASLPFPRHRRRCGGFAAAAAAAQQGDEPTARQGDGREGGEGGGGGVNVAESLAALDRLCAPGDPTCDPNAVSEDEATGSYETRVRPITRQIEVDIGNDLPSVAEFTLRNEFSRIYAVSVRLPLGIVLEEKDGALVIDDIWDDGNAAGTSVRVGDVLRATTAVTRVMTYPSMNLLLGGIGRPAAQRIFFMADGASFGNVIEAIKSNKDIDNEAILIFERPYVPQHTG